MGGYIEITCALLSLVGAFGATYLAYRLGMRQQKQIDSANEARAASMLYYDLKSIILRKKEVLLI